MGCAPAHFCVKTAGPAEVLDQLAGKAPAVFGFGRPIHDLLVEHLVEQSAVGIDIRDIRPRNHFITSMLRLTSSRRSFPDDVRGSEPGARNTTSAGTTPHCEATREIKSARA